LRAIGNGGMVQLDDLMEGVGRECVIFWSETASEQLCTIFYCFSSYVANREVMKDSLVDQLMERPDAKLIVDEVSQILEAERRLRQHFYETVREDEKAEFINGEIFVHSPMKKRHDHVSGPPF